MDNRRVIGRAVLAFVAATGLMSGTASACSCLMERSADAHLAIVQPALVFKGTAVRGRRTRDGGAATRFRVVEVLKGKAGRSVVVRHGLDEDSCGIRYRRGQTLLVMADAGPDGELRTSLCSQPFYSEAEYRRALRLGRKGPMAGQLPR